MRGSFYGGVQALRIFPDLLQITDTEVQDQAIAWLYTRVSHGRMIMRAPFMQAQDNGIILTGQYLESISPVPAMAVQQCLVPGTAAGYIFYPDNRFCSD